jgi:hypothetical protein
LSTPERVSLRAFAKLAGCDPKQVSRALKDGLLKRGEDGLLCTSQLSSEWRRPNKRSRNKAGVDKPESVSTDSEYSSLLPRADAERLKENMLARLRQLEFDQKAGAVVAVEDVARTVRDQYAKVRTRLLAIPSECATRVLQMKTAPEVQAVMQEAISDALEELTGVGGGQ